ncbi:alanine racemase [Moraxella caviae]|uniref:Alanine racemase n=1 Tax=Moraxella caviae TaxID=34060 RepID=A0A1T0A8N6_9GAMM|nr:alanine racemase [Moraxella caviae]OOR92077.1 alanine racemase [Moraxella caviae]STZ14431.1 Alanine racemase, catabolic [Moraxella caviae]VEW10482.1 Alanine racemase, catabolic [Moraxella caviae]
MRNTTITIDTNALAHNLNIITEQTHINAKPAKVLAMVKANAYGHGVANVIAGLAKADGFGVACFDEALDVKKACQAHGLSQPIVLIEGVFSKTEWQNTITQNFMSLIHCEAQLNWALQHLPPQDSHTRTVWLKYNTGMNRLGFDAEQATIAAQKLHQAGYRLILTSHFACADDEHALNAVQIARFDELLHSLRQTVSPDVQGSLCNSAGIFNFPNQHHNWVRAGIALYGSSPFANRSAHALNLRPVMTFGAQIMAVHELNAGESVSYGALWQADKSAFIGIVSAGYGDGYPRVVENGEVLVVLNGAAHRAPIIGRVAMDMLAVDLSAFDDKTALLHAPVILWGAQANAVLSIDDVARTANTIGYELMCRTTMRPVRNVI